MLIARNKDEMLYLGGLNSESVEKTQTVSFDFLPEGKKYRLTLIADGNHDKDFSTLYKVVDKNSEIKVRVLRRGGFVISLEPFLN